TLKTMIDFDYFMWHIASLRITAFMHPDVRFAFTACIDHDTPPRSMPQDNSCDIIAVPYYVDTGYGLRVYIKLDKRHCAVINSSHIKQTALVDYIAANAL